MRRRRSPICPLTLSAILSRRTIVLAGKPMAVSFPAANARHEHEWKIWHEVKLPAGKVIVPGVIDSTVNTVEHPEVAADRILNFANVVGRENVIAGVDCGFF
jgi:5-methyltetrahydropteroyltriglutamate--homocysteine methyltransferase